MPRARVRATVNHSARTRERERTAIFRSCRKDMYYLRGESVFSGRNARPSLSRRTGEPEFDIHPRKFLVVPRIPKFLVSNPGKQLICWGGLFSSRMLPGFDRNRLTSTLISTILHLCQAEKRCRTKQ